MADASDSHPLVNTLQSIAALIRERVTVDTRALAAMRIALGVVILIDLVHRAPYITYFYSDAGVYPRSVYDVSYPAFGGLSLHAISGEIWFQQFLFIVAGTIAILFLIGYRTRLTGLMSLILLFSLQARNPAVLNGADRLLVILLLVALLTPLGERWSIDALRRDSPRSHVASVGTTALLVQPLVVFTSNALAKADGVYWYSGRGLQVAMHNDVMTIYVGNILVDFPQLLVVLNYGWVVLLAGAVFFLFLPTGAVRGVVAFVYIGAFAGMLVTMAVGLFPLVLATAVLPYLTTPVWDTCARVRPPGIATRPLTPIGSQFRPPVERRIFHRLPDRQQSTVIRIGRRLATVVGVLVLAWMLVFASLNLIAIDPPGPMQEAHLEQQSWELYAPDPSPAYSWFVLEANTSDGTVIDPLDGGPVVYDRPPDAATEYETFRHRKFMESVRSSTGSPPGPIADGYAAWVCENAERPIEGFTLYQMYQLIPSNGEYSDPIRSERLVYDCP